MKFWIENGIVSRHSEERKVGGGGRVTDFHRKKSQSPGTRVKKQGEEFLKRLDELRTNL